MTARHDFSSFATQSSGRSRSGLATSGGPDLHRQGSATDAGRIDPLAGSHREQGRGPDEGRERPVRVPGDNLRDATGRELPGVRGGRDRRNALCLQ